MKFRLLFIFIAIVMAGCGPSQNDDVVNLGRGYYYRREGSEHKYIYYHMSGERKDIYPKIVDYVYDSSFVLVVQKPLKDLGRSHLASSLNYGQQNFEELLKNADSIIANDPYYVEIFSSPVNYWIIDKRDGKLFGPMSKTIFEEQKKLLGVSDNLLLQK